MVNKVIPPTALSKGKSQASEPTKRVSIRPLAYASQSQGDSMMADKAVRTLEIEYQLQGLSELLSANESLTAELCGRLGVLSNHEISSDSHPYDTGCSSAMGRSLESLASRINRQNSILREQIDALEV